MSRYLHARPRGVLVWLAVSPLSLERQLFEHLLGARDAVALNVPALAVALGHPVQAIARALFALNRHASIAVRDAAASVTAVAPGGLASLPQDMVDIAGQRGEIMLASADGFCIAQAGLPSERAEAVAAQLSLGIWPVMSFRAALQVGGRVLNFCASSEIDLAHPAMLRLGAHLVRGGHSFPVLASV